MPGLRHYWRQHIGQALCCVLCAMPGLCRDGCWRKGQAQKRRTWNRSRRCCGGRRTARACRCATTSSPSATAVARRSCTLIAPGASPLRVAALLLRAPQARCYFHQLPHVLARHKWGTPDAASVAAGALQACHDTVGRQALPSAALWLPDVWQMCGGYVLVLLSYAIPGKAAFSSAPVPVSSHCRCTAATAIDVDQSSRCVSSPASVSPGAACARARA